MSQISANIARQIRMIRARYGTDVYFKNLLYRAMTEEVAGNLSGIQTLSHVKLGVYLAAAEARLFSLSPLEFDPNTTVPPPTESDTIVWHGLNYLVTHVTYEDFAEDTVSILCYCYRNVE